MLVFACFALEDFRYTSGKAAIYFSTKNGERRFCPACGTHIEYRERQNALFAEVNIGALDQPELFPPQFHIWESSRIRWLHIDDELPRYSENEPSSNNI